MSIDRTEPTKKIESSLSQQFSNPFGQDSYQSNLDSINAMSGKSAGNDWLPNLDISNGSPEKPPESSSDSSKPDQQPNDKPRQSP